MNVCKPENSSYKTRDFSSNISSNVEKMLDEMLDWFAPAIKGDTHVTSTLRRWGVGGKTQMRCRT